MNDFLSGLRAAAVNARLLGWLLAGHLVLAVVASAPLLRPLEESLSHREGAAAMARHLDMSWWVDVTTSRAEAFAGALDGVAAAAALAALMGCFFAGGTLQAYRDALDGLPMDRFMTSCRRWWPRFLALFALTLPFYWLVHRLLNRQLAPALDGLFERIDDERAGLLIEWARTALFLALFDLVTLVGDYARVHAVVAPDRSVISSLAAGARFVLGHPLRVARLEALALLLQAAALALFLPVDRLVGRAAGTVSGAVLALIAAESFLLARLFLRETARAAQVAFYRGARAASR